MRLIPAGVKLGYDFVEGKYVSQFREIGNGSPSRAAFVPSGQGEASITGWENSLREEFGEYIDPANIAATFIRLRNSGLIRLLKFVPDQTAWYNYAPDEQVDYAWFFYSASIQARSASRPSLASHPKHGKSGQSRFRMNCSNW